MIIFWVILYERSILNSYILGLMATDGFMDKYVGKTCITYSERIELSDEQIMKDIATYLNVPYKHRVRHTFGKERHCYSVRIPNEIFEGFEEAFRGDREGLFELYQNSNKADFIRGMFDGDGSVCSFNRGLRVTGVVNSNHKDTLKIWQDFARENGLYLYVYYDKRGNGSYNLSFNRKDGVNFIFNFMYSNDPKLFLKRKYDVFVNHGFPNLVTG